MIDCGTFVVDEDLQRRMRIAHNDLTAATGCLRGWAFFFAEENNAWWRNRSTTYPLNAGPKQHLRQMRRLARSSIRHRGEGNPATLFPHLAALPDVDNRTRISEMLTTAEQLMEEAKAYGVGDIGWLPDGATFRIHPTWRQRAMVFAELVRVETEKVALVQKLDMLLGLLGAAPQEGEEHEVERILAFFNAPAMCAWYTEVDGSAEDVAIVRAWLRSRRAAVRYLIEEATSLSLSNDVITSHVAPHVKKVKSVGALLGPAWRRLRSRLVDANPTSSGALKLRPCREVDGKWVGVADHLVVAAAAVQWFDGVRPDEEAIELVVSSDRSSGHFCCSLEPPFTSQAVRPVIVLRGMRTGRLTVHFETNCGTDSVIQSSLCASEDISDEDETSRSALSFVSAETAEAPEHGDDRYSGQGILSEFLLSQLSDHTEHCANPSHRGVDDWIAQVPPLDSTILGNA